MHTVAFPLDVAGPGLVVALGVGLAGGLVLLAGIILVEGLAIWLLRWGNFWRSLLGSLVMNIVSSIVGLLFLTLGGLLGAAGWLMLTFVASVLVEGGVLALMNRSKAQRGLLAALVANLVTYLPLGLLWLYGSRL